MDIRYCLKCEKYVSVSQGYLGPVHMATYQNAGEPMEFDWCDGPFVTSEPPEKMSEDEWEETFLHAPDPDEMMKINEENEHLVEY